MMPSGMAVCFALTVGVGRWYRIPDGDLEYDAGQSKKWRMRGYHACGISMSVDNGARALCAGPPVHHTVVPLPFSGS